jgi:hypothetical protein
MGSGNGVPINIKSQSWPSQGRELTGVQLQPRFLNQVFNQQVIHVLVAIIEVRDG